MTLPKTAEFHLSGDHVRRALDHLASNDTQLAEALSLWGYPQERRTDGGFPALLRIIIGQQLSVKAAATIAARVDAAMDGEATPERFLGLEDDILRGAGLSAAKVRYGRGLAEAIAGGQFDPDGLHLLDDAEALEKVTALKGFGIWSGRMYLMFSLGRPDIWPADDLGVREGVRRIRGLEDRPSIKEADALGEGWAPYRSSAALMCWHILNNAPA